MFTTNKLELLKGIYFIQEWKNWYKKKKTSNNSLLFFSSSLFIFCTSTIVFFTDRRDGLYCTWQQE